MKLPEFDSATIARVVEMAWEDRTTFDAIVLQYELQEKQMIAVMHRVAIPQRMARPEFKIVQLPMRIYASACTNRFSTKGEVMAASSPP